MSRARRGGAGAPDDRGQATVELALLLPVLFTLVLLVIQAGLIVRDQVLVVHAAREAARLAAVEGDHGRAQAAARSATGLAPERMEVTVAGRGDGVVATVRYRSTIVVPFLRRALGDVRVSGEVTMHDESTPSRRSITVAP